MLLFKCFFSLALYIPDNRDNVVLFVLSAVLGSESVLVFTSSWLEGDKVAGLGRSVLRALWMEKTPEIS